MNYLDNLIAEHCPDGVTFETLGSIGDWYGGGTPAKSRIDYWQNGTIPWVSPKDMAPRIIESTKDYITEAAVEGSSTKLVPAGAVCMVVRSSILNKRFPTALVERSISLNQDMKAVVPHKGVLPQYLAHLLEARGPSILRTARKSGGSVDSIDSGRLLAFRIPVPPIFVQQEIVRILDQFNQLETALEREIDTRKLLREAYRYQLPMSDYIVNLAPDGFEQVRLGNIATQFVDPVQVEDNEMYVNLGVRWYGEGAFARPPKAGKEIKSPTLYRVKSGQFIYNRMFVTEGSFGIITPNLAEGVVSNEFPVYELDRTRVVPEWLLLKFQDPFTVKSVAAQAAGGTKSRRRWREKQFEAFVVDLPPLEAQREIVRILATFSSLEAELACELGLRRSQFAVYRDRLFCFEESVT